MEQSPNRLVIFNYNGLVRESKRLNINPIDLLRIIFFSTKSKAEEYKKHRVNLVTVMKGDNFLVNPLDLINSTYDLSYRLMYLELASLRSYSHYKLTKHKHIELDLWPDLRLDLARINPLVKVEGDYALFLLLEESVSTSKK